VREVAVLLLAQNRDRAGALVAQAEVAAALLGQDGYRDDDAVVDRERSVLVGAEGEVDGDSPVGLLVGEDVDRLDTTPDPRPRVGKERRTGDAGAELGRRLLVAVMFVEICVVFGHTGS
jgi:hypothetical protein